MNSPSISLSSSMYRQEEALLREEDAFKNSKKVYLIKYSKTGPCCTWLASCSPRTSSWKQFHGPSSHFLFLFYFSSPVTNIGSRDMVFLQLFKSYLITQTRSCDAASSMGTKESNQLIMICTRLQAQNSKDLKLPNHSKLDGFKEKRQAMSSGIFSQVYELHWRLTLKLKTGIGL